MDKIFKNNTVMGIVAIATLVLVGLMWWSSRKPAETPTLPPIETKE